MRTRQHPLLHERLSTPVRIGQIYQHPTLAQVLRVTHLYSAAATWSGRPEVGCEPIHGGDPVVFDHDRFLRQFVLA